MTDQMTTATNNNVLEALVIAQLAAIRRREADLQSRLELSMREPANVAAANVVTEVWQLQTSADRLSRMMDAMNFGGNTAAFAA